MCTDDTPAGHVHLAPLLHDFEPSVTFDLEPVDSVTVTTLMDNVTDVFMPDQGPARRAPAAIGGRRPAAVMEGGLAPNALVAEHGFSVLVTVTKNGSRHQILFDTGTSPDGVTENMDRALVGPVRPAPGFPRHSVSIRRFMRRPALDRTSGSCMVFARSALPS
jgi:7,8-dihydropterin-6-yl-methyl-4-(beta-D-ribofuranosyl)aminobenzene 5'-phosphate synthase